MRTAPQQSHSAGWLHLGLILRRQVFNVSSTVTNAMGYVRGVANWSAHDAFVGLQIRNGDEEGANCVSDAEMDAMVRLAQEHTRNASNPLFFVASDTTSGRRRPVVMPCP